MGGRTYKHSVVRPKFDLKSQATQIKFLKLVFCRDFQREAKWLRALRRPSSFHDLPLSGSITKSASNDRSTSLFRLFFSSILNFNFRFRKKSESNRLYFLVPKARIGAIFSINFRDNFILDAINIEMRSSWLSLSQKQLRCACWLCKTGATNFINKSSHLE